MATDNILSNKPNLNNTESTPTGTIVPTRRAALIGLLGALAGATAATFTPLGKCPPGGQLNPEAAAFGDENYIYVKRSELTVYGASPAPYPDPDRTAVIDQWLAQLDGAITQLEGFWSYLEDVRATAPADVDGPQIVQKAQAINIAIGSLAALFDSDAFDDLVEVAAGCPVFDLVDAAGEVA